MTNLYSQFPSRSQPLLMGILNTTPDSFSDGGMFHEAQAAIEHGHRLISDGAAIIDVGGESTGPGREGVSAKTEITRIIDVVRALAAQHFVSVDTFKAQTAEVCLKLGAKMINDVSALRADPELVAVVRDHQAFIVLMYSKESGDHPHATQSPKEYANVIEEIGDFLAQRIDYALGQGISADRMLLDPGMGSFLSPNPEYSWIVLRELHSLKNRFRDFPILIGTSRKGFLGGAVTERDPLSQLTALVAHLNGASIIRTHNPAMAKDFLATWQKIGRDTEAR